ncbi:uncharacterized protein G2W53_040076 [Senna tora]|uniref:Uncharacterized protein n=1 Tax=Senna tora TaxID=362788 RepID=A0A834SS48_9FABA|nr:uncharacterized protein G2W53_040076 [Senna tora]
MGVVVMKKDDSGQGTAATGWDYGTSKNCGGRQLTTNKVRTRGTLNFRRHFEIVISSSKLQEDAARLEDPSRRTTQATEK